jgi:phosphatidate cytidylyltransferase
MLRHRLIFGTLLIVGLLGFVVLDNWLDTVELSGFVQRVFDKDHPPRGLAMFLLCVCVVAPLSAMEFARIVRANQIAVRTWLMTMAAIFGLVLSYSIPMRTETTQAIAIVATGMIVVFIASLLTFSQNRNVQGVVAAAGAVVFAMVYLGLMLGFFLALRRWHSAWLIVGIILVTKACDSGAYFTGRAIGKHKMIPWLSPGKTWEGMVGGIVGAVLVGWLLALASAWLPEGEKRIPVWLGMVAGVLFAIVGQLGDLTMSLFKRGAGIKDSSQILPGLGGVLDVMDSPLLVAPVAYWLFSLGLGAAP